MTARVQNSLSDHTKAGQRVGRGTDTIRQAAVAQGQARWGAGRMPAAGDLIFFRGTGRWYERLIQARTSGPFVHVEVVRSAGESVGAIARRGVERHPLPSGGVVAATARACDPVRLRRALAWLDAQVGDR